MGNAGKVAPVQEVKFAKKIDHRQTKITSRTRIEWNRQLIRDEFPPFQ